MLSPIFYSIILQNASWQDFVDLRRAIDIGTLYVLVGRGPKKEELGRLRAALQNLEKAVSAKKLDVQKITEADCTFHNEIISLTENPQLKTLSEYINRKRRDRQVCPSASGTLSDCLRGKPGGD